MAIFIAAYAVARWKPLHELEDFQRIFATNLKGAFLCMKHEIAAMLNDWRSCGRGPAIPFTDQSNGAWLE